MGRAKEIEVRVIPRDIANDFIKKHHYSGKVMQSSQVHFGCFLDGKLGGVMQFGSCIDRKKMQGLVKGSGWNEFVELNRMAFTDALPRNSESRCISIAIKLLKKNAPQIKWIISFADGCSCGDGTIYRASGFVLTDIKKNFNLCLLPSGEKIHKLTLENSPNKPRPELNGKTYFEITGGKYSFKQYVDACGGQILAGYQLRYIYFVDPSYRKRLTVPEIPFSAIDECNAGMYKGKKVSQRERHKDA
jgi:hypothetical protein